jgi:hypothetical protein
MTLKHHGDMAAVFVVMRHDIAAALLCQADHACITRKYLRSETSNSLSLGVVNEASLQFGPQA